VCIYECVYTHVYTHTYDAPQPGVAV